MKKIVLILCLLGILYLSGCVLEYREGLPAKIVITEIPDPVPESIECQNPPCATLVQMSNIRRTEFVCSPTYKPANNDPQGTVYNEHFGDECEPLPHPTTVCLKYDCDFDRHENIGFYEINCRYSHSFSGEHGFFENVYNNSLGVIQSGWRNDPDRNVISVSPGSPLVCEYYSSLMFKSPGELNLITPNPTYFSNYYESYPKSSNVGVFYKDKWITFGTWPAMLTNVVEKNCPAEMPIIYPYNVINFAYNPIINRSDIENPPTDFVRNLQSDYIYLKNQGDDYIKKSESIDKESGDPCYDICANVGDSIFEGGEDTTPFQEDCNICQEERRESLKENRKAETRNLDIVSYSYYDLNPKAENGPICTGMNPCVETDRTEYYYNDGSLETRYHICQCSCEATIYAGWYCQRSIGTANYYYTSCERNDILSDQGGYIFSIHGFEAELFMRVLGRVDNKMPMFMIGQGSTFEDYFDAKRECEPEVTADEIIIAGDKPFNPGEIEIIEGSPLCFINDGIYSRNLSIDSFGNHLIFLEPNQGMCFDTGPDTNFSLRGAPYKIYVNDNNVYASVKIIAPENLDDVVNIIRNNENEELKFFFNNNIELSLLYASAPLGKTFIHQIQNGIDLQHHEYSAIGTGEFPIISSISVDDYESPLTWIAYETGYDSMEVIRHDLYKEKYDLWKDGYIDINDYIFATLLVAEDEDNLVIFNELLNEYEYFEKINLLGEGGNVEKIDYPIIKKGVSYLEFNPGAIILPLNSKFCVNNSMNEKVDLILEKKFNPEYSRKIDEIFRFDEYHGIEIISMIYSGKNLPNVLLKYTFGLPYYIYFNSIGKTNTHYSFVQSQSVAQGLQCCFHLGEPGIYRVSGLRGETGTGYVVVLPTDVTNTIRLRDYEYEPSYLIPNEGDFVCIRNPYDFERKIEISGSISDLITIGASTEYCSYNWASKKDDNIFFYDKTTGGSSEMLVTNASILNIEIMGEMFLQTRGKISDSGTICLINKDNEEVEVIPKKLNQEEKPPIKIKPQSMECYSASSPEFGKGLHRLEILRDEEELFEFSGGHYYITIADENEGYIYGGEMYGSPLNIRLEEFDFVSHVFQEREERKIVIHNLDNLEYTLYSKITLDDISGLLTSSYYIQTPDIYFENDGDVDVKITILNYNLPAEEIEVKANSGGTYTVRKGDYQVNILYLEETDLHDYDFGTTFRERASLNLNRMILREGAEYYADGNKEFEIEGIYPSIKFKDILELDIGTSNSQRIHFGLDGDNVEIEGILIQLTDSGIVDSFIIDPIISRKSEIEMQRLSGRVNNLDFAVQVLNDVPTSEMLYDAKRMLAYDDALPVFMYSRMGNVEVGIDNPFKSELHEIPRGSEVSYVKSDWLLSNNDYVVSHSPSTPSILYGENNHNVLENDITFTIEAPSGAKKNVYVRAIDNPKTILMDYTAFKIEEDGGTGDKQYFVNNLAHEPRAFNFRPDNDLVDKLCIEFNGKISEDIDIKRGSLEGSASNMMLYELTGSSNNLNDIRYHSEIYGDKLASSISEIYILPNYGIYDAEIILSRVDSSSEQVGYLMIKPEYTLEDFDLNYIEGYISGLEETYYVRAYRFYGADEKIEIKVDSEVYNPENFDVDDSDQYSVLARTFTLKENTGSSHIDKLLEVSNLYLRMKDAKAIPNKWHLTELSGDFRVHTLFSDLLQGRDTYFEESKRGVSTWVEIQEYGHYLVPFDNERIFHTFAFDVPITRPKGTTDHFDIANVDYMRTIKLDYPYAIQRIDSNFQEEFALYDGEIINDVRFLMSENPNEADEIIGYYSTEKKFNYITGHTSSVLNKNYYIGFACYDGEIKKDFSILMEGGLKNVNLLNAIFPGYGRTYFYVPIGFNCGNRNALSSADGTGPRFLYWACSVNIDAFGWETNMLGCTSGTGCWNILPKERLYGLLGRSPNDVPISTIPIENRFDGGVSHNPQTYDFMSEGYFDFFGMDSRTSSTCGKNPDYCDPSNLVCCDRGCKRSNLIEFYSISAKELKQSGMDEQALTFGLFFMINSVDTADYYFADEFNDEETVEFSMGYALSRNFDVENNQGRKLLCVGADTFDGKDIILGPGEKDSFTLDLKTNYNIYEPAFFTNLEMSGERSFMYPSLFSRSDLEEYIISTFNYDKPMDGNHIKPFPDYQREVNIYLYNLTMKLDYFDNEIDFEVVNLFEGESLILKNVGEESIEWFYGVDDICSKDSFSNILQLRHLVSCPPVGDNYKSCLDNPKDYSSNPSDISEYLKDREEVLSVIVEPGEEITLSIEELKVINDDSSTEYLFYNAQTGRRFNVIVSRDTYVVDLDVNTFNQDSVNVLDNDNSNLCFRNYHSNPIDLLVGSETHSISAYSKECIEHEKLFSEIKDSTLKRELEVNLEGFTPDENKNVLSVLEQITKRVTESTRASFHPALNFFELNVGASATPAIITTEIIDYRAINNYYDKGTLIEGTFIHIPNPNHIPDLVDSVAEQVYTIVSNSRISHHDICGDGENMKKINKNNLCVDTVPDEYGFLEDTDKDSMLGEMVAIDCEKEFEGDEEAIEECELQKQKISEALEAVDFLTVINEDQVLTTLPILIQFEGGKTELSEIDVENMKNFIDEVNEKVRELCAERKDCDNKLEINENCGKGEYDNYWVMNRYLDVIGFIVLIDDPGPNYEGDCSLMFNYLDGIMEVSIDAATHNLEKGKMGTPSMILGLGINRKSNPTESCWTDFEFKKEIESLFTTDFMIMLDSGIIGLGHYCLRDGECLPISTGIQGDDYGLYMTREPSGWSSFRPIVIDSLEKIDLSDFNNLNQEDKEKCVLIGGLPYCPPDFSENGGFVFEGGLIGGGIVIGSPGLSPDDLTGGNIFDSGSIEVETGIGSPGLSPGDLTVGNIFDSGSIGGGIGIGSPGLSPDGLIGGNIFDSSSIVIDSGTWFGTGSSPFISDFGTGGFIQEISFEIVGDKINIIQFPHLLSNGIMKEPLGREWFNRCGRYYYKGEGMTMVTYPEVDIPKGQQGAACNPGRVMELYKQFNC